MAQWRIELATQDVVALSQGDEIVVTAIDEEQEGLAVESIDVRIVLADI
jgi:precorrin-4 methylase